MSKKRCATNAPDELLEELDMTISIMVFACVKEIGSKSGQASGEMPCPRCKTGKLRWSIASSNGHARAVCDRVVGQRNGEDVHCVAAME